LSGIGSKQIPSTTKQQPTMKSMSNHNNSQHPSPHAGKGKPKLIEKTDTLRKLCGVLFLSSLGCLTASANTAFTGMRNLTTLQITADMGAGWNLGNSLDANPNETSWGNPATTQAMITAIKQRGFKTLRIPVRWDNFIGPAPNYTINSARLARVEDVANYAFANDMYVTINTHHDNWIIPTYANQSAVSDKLSKVWTQIANRFRNYGDYLIFETMNEPRESGHPEEWTGGSAEHRAVVNAYNLAAVNAIRNTGGNNSTRHIMIPTCGNNGGSGAVNALTIPNNDSRIIVTTHNYSPYQFCLQEPGTSSWGTAAERSALEAEFNIVYNRFVANGRGVVIGEFGSVNKNNTSARATHAGYVASLLKSKGMVPIVWDNGATGSSSGSMGLFNRSSLTWAFPTIADAITGPFNGGSGGGGGPVANGTYRIIARHSGKAMDANGAGTANGTQIIQWTYGGGNNQRWTVTNRGNNQYSIVGVQSGRAVEVSNSSTANGAKVQLWDYLGANNQKYTFTATSGGYYRITPVHATGSCLDVSGVSTANGALVHLWTYGGGNNQQWAFQAP
jgi:endoglucanase